MEDTEPTRATGTPLSSPKKTGVHFGGNVSVSRGQTSQNHTSEGNNFDLFGENGDDEEENDDRCSQQRNPSSRKFR